MLHAIRFCPKLHSVFPLGTVAGGDDDVTLHFCLFLLADAAAQHCKSEGRT